MLLFRSLFPPHTTVIFNPGDWTPTKLSLLHNLVESPPPPREDYHLSLTTLEGYHPLERVITSLTLPWGIITPWRGLSPLACYPGGLLPPHLSNHYPGGLPTPTQRDLSSSFRVPHPLPLFPTIIVVQLFTSIVTLWVRNINGEELYKKKKQFTRRYFCAQTVSDSKGFHVIL